MIIIYPKDPSTKFLKSIVDKVKEILEVEVNYALPEAYPATIDFISSKDENETIFFLGHGYSNALYGGCYVASGKKILINLDNAEFLFKNKKVILFACKSSEFISNKFEIFNVALGFGNIKTDKEDLVGQKEKKKYRDYNSIRIFREKLVFIFSSSLIEAIQLKSNFQQFYYSLELRMNKSINDFSLSNELNNKLAGELMFEVKKEMVLFGNKKAKL
jgi:hypothetical protein